MAIFAWLLSQALHVGYARLPGLYIIDVFPTDRRGPAVRMSVYGTCIPAFLKRPPGMWRMLTADRATDMRWRNTAYESQSQAAELPLLSASNPFAQLLPPDISRFLHSLPLPSLPSLSKPRFPFQASDFLTGQPLHPWNSTRTRASHFAHSLPLLHPLKPTHDHDPAKPATAHGSSTARCLDTRLSARYVRCRS